MKFVIKLSKILASSGLNKYYYFVLEARNGEIIATSEMYNSKQACKKGINAVRKMLFARTVDLTN